MTGTHDSDPFATPPQQPGMSDPVGGYSPPPPPPPSGSQGGYPPPPQVPPAYVAPSEQQVPTASESPAAEQPAAPTYNQGGYPPPPPPAYITADGSVPPAGYAPGGYSNPGQGFSGQSGLYPAQAAPGSNSKNVLGILALIAPFVCLPPVGIILGHLGLSAVKKGQANNRGIALAGTIISWIVTAFSAVFLVLVFVGALNSSNTEFSFDPESGVTADAGALDDDLLAIQSAVEDELSFNPDSLPDVAIEGNSYVVGSTTVEMTSDAFTAAIVGDVSTFYYCIELWHFDGVRSLTNAGEFSDDYCSVLGDGGTGSVGGDTDSGTDTGGNTDASGDEWAEGLYLGMCITDPYVGAETNENGAFTIGDYEEIDCNQTHYGEIYAIGYSSLTTFDNDALVTEIGDYCYVNFEPYVGLDYNESELYYDYWYPSQETWDSGDRVLVCLVTTVDGVVNEPLAGANR